MNYQQSVLQRLKRRVSKKFLLIFSFCTIAAAGIVWACADGGYYEDQDSNFTPEAFVDKAYTPFFYASYLSYYGDSYDDNSNTRYNAQVVNDWYSWFDKKLDKTSLEALIIKAKAGGIDSTYSYYTGKLNVLPAGMPDIKNVQLDRKKVNAFFEYLTLAKSCEGYAVDETNRYWDDKAKVKEVPNTLENTLLAAIDKTKDSFIKQRLWFQLVRYYYFQQKMYKGSNQSTEVPLPAYFAKTEAQFPKNMMYYRALGYLAGYYYQKGNYAQANYLYSLCYNFSFEMKIPSRWSFHPQNESDWNATLALAKNGEEKITLWHMVGTSQDEARAIKEIYAINPQSEKLDLLLSRLVNKRELSAQGLSDTSAEGKSWKLALNKEILLVNNIANEGKTHKPFYWNLAAGYLNTLSNKYTVARTYYDKAKGQLPKNDKLIMAQYKILDWTLYLKQLKTIDAAAEAKMVEPLNWLANLRNQKDTIPSLRFYKAIEQSLDILSAQYKKQGHLMKSNCFRPTPDYYTSNVRIENLKTLLNKKEKTPFEKAMLNYCSVTVGDLTYLQGTLLVYQEKIDEAITYIGDVEGELPANPFNMRLNDCHDCDHMAKTKTKITVASFLKTLKEAKQQVAAGKDVARNATLLANAYYNITHYGNARAFYESTITGSSGAISPSDIPTAFRKVFTDNKISEKYYLIARDAAKTKEQKAKLTFMASKCERNEQYNAIYNAPSTKKMYYWDFSNLQIPTGKYFAELKGQYAQTQYYNEVLRECGYFKTYVSKRH